MQRRCSNIAQFSPPLFCIIIVICITFICGINPTIRCYNYYFTQSYVFFKEFKRRNEKNTIRESFTLTHTFPVLFISSCAFKLMSLLFSLKGFLQYFLKGRAVITFTDNAPGHGHHPRQQINEPPQTTAAYLSVLMACLALVEPPHPLGWRRWKQSQAGMPHTSTVLTQRPAVF